MKNSFLTLGLDLDGTITNYGKALGKLAISAEKVYIITVNEVANKEMVSKLLQIDIEKIDKILIMPDFTTANFSQNIFEQVAKWKYETCKKYEIDVMIDDDVVVANYLLRRGIACIKVDGEFTLKSDKEVLNAKWQ